MNTPAVRRLVTQLIMHRLAVGITQRSAAELIGVSENHMGCLERQTKTPSADTLDAWAGVFGRQLALAIDSVFEFDSTEAAGAELRHIRHEVGMTLVQVSELTGIDPTNLSAIETGRRRAEISTLLRMASALGCRMAFVWEPR